MCVAVPGEVVKINDFLATIRVGNIYKDIYIHLVPEVKIGQYVLVHAGCAIDIIDEEEAYRILKLLEELYR
jgi:hydrogenase expression/formation protein HypC